jgi:hypothetical protein
MIIIDINAHAIDSAQHLGHNALEQRSHGLDSKAGTYKIVMNSIPDERYLMLIFVS